MQARKAMEQSQSNLWQALREHEQAREAAEMARKAKDHFLAVLSHELRTPLTPVLMGTQTLARQTDLPPMTREALEMIDRNIRSEIRLIDDLLDVTRIERGEIELESEPLRLHDVLRHTLEVTLSDIEARKQVRIVNFEALRDDLRGDLLRLQQVFWNLLKNASKFTAEGGTIAVQSWNEGEQIVVAITDSVIGLDPASIGHIFEPFTQADIGVTREFGGLGLGLAIATVIVEAHQGTLGVASKGRAQGATFTTRLPLSGA